MMKISKSICINAPKYEVWQVLADLPRISDWSDLVVTAKMCTQKTRGLHAVRICTLKNKSTVTERIIQWKEGDSLTYQGSGIPMVKDAINKWSVVSPSIDQTILTTEANVVLKGPRVIQLLLTPLLRYASEKMVNDTLASFKYLVENGQPYQGARNGLPKPSVHC